MTLHDDTTQPIAQDPQLSQLVTGLNSPHLPQPPLVAPSVTVQPAGVTVRGRAAGVIIVDTRRALVMLETGHNPVYYLPRRDFRDGVLVPVRHSTFCARKGTAWYWDVHRPDRVVELGAWTYPTAGDRVDLGDYAALRSDSLDEWYLNGTLVPPVG